MRFVRRGNGNGNGNGNGHFDLGYEPFVSIHIATYNEKRVIGRLLEGCAALDYTNYEVILVDDSTDETAAILDTWLGHPRFKIFHRPNRDGFKGGALQVALAQTDARAEFVLVWDADVVPFADSIQSFLPHFFKTNGNGNGEKHPPEPRPEVAAVQSYQWHILNKSESWLTEAVRAEYAGSYMVERPFQEFVGALKMVAGTAYMIRGDLLKKLGWGRSLTEDWELTLRLYALGYKVAYTPYAESPAECVATFSRLARQRMRWAEGHSFNVRRYFAEVVGSKHLGAMEKLEFLYYTVYYLQAALFIVGSAGWFVSEVFLHVHVPEWTATLGWSLLFSNLLSLPLMNIAGLLLEGAPAKDFVGVAGALATSFLLVPFQAYASLKGLFEKEEGPWYRTPKTGRVTDPIQHLRRLAWLKRWLRGPKSRARPVIARMTASEPAPKARRPSRIGWMLIGGMTFLLALAALGGFNAPTVLAAGTTLWLQGTAGCTGAGCHLQATDPNSGQQHVVYNTTTTSNIWSETSSNPSAQVVPAGNVYTFTYSDDGGANVLATITFYYSVSTPCGAPTGTTNLISWSATLLDNGGNPLSVNSPASVSPVTIPGGAFLCLWVQGHTLSGQENLNYNDTNHPGEISSADTLFVPELALGLVGLALIAPFATRLVRRRRMGARA